MGPMADCAGSGTNVLSLAAALPVAKRDVVAHQRALAIHAQIASAGRESRRGGDGYDWLGLRRGSTPFVLLQYTLAGEGSLTWAGTDHHVPVGSAMLVNVPHDHRYRVPAGGRWDFLWVCLVGQEPRDAWRAIHAQHGPVLRLAEDAPLLAAAVAAAATVLREPDATPYRTSALAYAIAMAVAEIAHAGPGPLQRHDGLARAARMCREQACEDLSVARLARAAGLSRHHFTRSFATAFGMGPKEYLTDQRIRLACLMLRDGGQVQEVAAACGFHDATYFCKVFRRVIGMSPGAYRDSGMFVSAGRRAGPAVD